MISYSLNFTDNYIFWLTTPFRASIVDIWSQEQKLCKYVTSECCFFSLQLSSHHNPTHEVDWKTELSWLDSKTLQMDVGLECMHVFIWIGYTSYFV